MKGLRKMKYFHPLAWLIGGLAILALALAGCARSPAATGAQSGDPGSTDPQSLMIPRWFLSALEVEGQQVAVAEGQQRATIQFKEDGSANGGGGCNEFFTTYAAEAGGAIQFSPVGATKMFCEGWMELETAHFNALARVDRFEIVDYQLVLSASDGSARIVYSMPPK